MMMKDRTILTCMLVICFLMALVLCFGAGDAFDEREPQKRVNVVIEATPTHWLEYTMWGSAAAASLIAAGFGLWKWRKARRAKAECDHS